MGTLQRVLRRVLPAQQSGGKGKPGGTGPRGVDYEGAWNQYARQWSQRFPGLRHLGDEWTGQEAGAAQTVEEYTRLIEEKYVTPYVTKDDTVLEIGVGGGRTAVLLRAHGKRLICADIAADMLAATRERLGDDGVDYVKIDGIRLAGIEPKSVDVAFCFDTMVHIEPRDIYNYLTRVPALMRGRRICLFHHSNMLSERGWNRFLGEWDKNLMGKRHGRSFSVMTDSIMERFLTHLGYEILVKDTESIPRDCVWVVRAPEVD
ncbi:class I SAM-dependent methyltransferase [Rhizomonospora bruguierae]|uniref:class I SAM-dependent methyltransferase n=1 Tax=Rhizomonospora bruguierae TaxID=1581705 RepID=UPI001BCEDF58|nr:class I SAM-dependent methyltransferase [Micromonospora sp. NBRC 107566]